jgi:hypothetical protein
MSGFGQVHAHGVKDRPGEVCANPNLSGRVGEGMNDEVRAVPGLQSLLGVCFQRIEHLSSSFLGYACFIGDTINNLIRQADQGIKVPDVKSGSRVQKSRG